MTSESVLLIGLEPDEIAIIRRLTASFEISVECVEGSRLKTDQPFSSEHAVCLVLFRLDETLYAPEQKIRQLRHNLPKGVPILLLIPWDVTFEIKDYLDAGADEYWVLPLNETTFAVQFYVMLEWGQAIVRDGLAKEQHEATSKGSVWQRISGRIQKGFRYFSPGSLLKSESVSQSFRKWQKIRPLGIGHYAQVWLVKQRQSGPSPVREQYAVAKIPHTVKSNLAFLRAGSILKRMGSHPNAVHLIEVVEDDRKVILIEEFVPGNTLQKYVDTGMDPALKEKIFLQLLEVISYAHQLKIMHRDIKPDNMIITPDGNLKLLDFGIARDLSRYSFGDAGFGSRPYMSPEQFMGNSCIASDVWALGVMLYVLATSCFPFYDHQELNYLDVIRDSIPVPPRNMVPELPEALEAIIYKCLEKNTAQRYKDAGELLAELLKRFPDFGKGMVLI